MHVALMARLLPSLWKRVCWGRHPSAPLWKGVVTPTLPPTTVCTALPAVAPGLAVPAHIPSPHQVRGQALPRHWKELDLPPLFFSGLGLERGDIKKLLLEAAHMTRGAANGPQGWLAVNFQCVKDRYKNLQMHAHRKYTSIQKQRKQEKGEGQVCAHQPSLSPFTHSLPYSFGSMK